MTISQLHAAPTSAYRADMQGRHEPFGPHDDAWLAVASALHLAAMSEKSSAERLDEALALAAATVSSQQLAKFSEKEWRGDRPLIGPLLLLADEMHWAGALHL